MAIKLNKTQINALIDKAFEKNKSIRTAELNAKLKKLKPEIDRRVKEAQKKINALPNEVLAYFFSNGYGTPISKKKDACNSVRNKVIKEMNITADTKELIYSDKERLRTSIVLAAIDAKDMEALCTMLGISI